MLNFHHGRLHRVTVIERGVLGGILLVEERLCLFLRVVQEKKYTV